jgi:hypothetical protein
MASVSDTFSETKNLIGFGCRLQNYPCSPTESQLHRETVRTFDVENVVVSQLLFVETNSVPI